jgi:hypothetical protein
MRKLKNVAAALAAAGLIGGALMVTPSRAEVAAAKPAAVWKTAVTPKALSSNVDRGLAWLAKHQLDNGAWGQGDEAQGMGNSRTMRDASSVADTSMALLAFLRAGHTARQGAYSQKVRRGLEYVIGEIERSDEKSLYVTQTRGTRVQSKIGTYVDTFTALMVLTEAKGTMGDDNANARLARALAKVIAKIEKNQQQNGTWANEGWAPALTQSIATKGLNRAAQAGEKIADQTIARVEKQAKDGFDGRGFASGGTAGIDLYGAAATTSAVRDSANTRAHEEEDVKLKLAGAKNEAERKQYQARLDEGQKTRAAAEGAEQALLKRLEDPAFIRGFGNNGGEEFLSYMLMSEALVVKGGGEWKKWDGAITSLVNGVQNQDGSWTGHHCITGRTFCTAAALLVLMADRAPVPLAGKLRG